MERRLTLPIRIISATIVTLAEAIFCTAQTTLPTDTSAEIPQQHLGEIVVTARTPAVRVTPDRTVYDLKSTVMGQSGTLLDALGSIPGVNVSDNGSVSLYGNRGATISIDGQKTYLRGQELANYLRSLPASTVSTITLRTTASARDDAADKNGVIEISTRRIRERGLTLGLNGGLSAWRNLRGNGSLNLAYNTGRSEFSLLYSFFAARQRIRLDIDRHYITDDNRMLQTSSRRRTDNAHTVKGGWRYHFSPNTSLGTSLNLSRNCRNEFGRMDSSIPLLSEIDCSDNRNRSRWRNLMTDIYLNHCFTSGAELIVGINHFRYNTSEHHLLQSTTPDTLRSTVEGRVRWLIDRIDYTRPVGKDIKFQAGIKNTFVSINNIGNYYDRGAGGWTHNPDLSSTFRYRANTNAAYTQISFTRGRLAATVGARLEHERLHGTFSGNEAAADTSYRINTFDIVPAAEIKYLTPGGAAFMLSYSRRVDRPNYADLNPFIYVFDEYTHAGGNIHLHSSSSDNLQLGFSHGGRFQGVLFLTYSADVIMKSYHEISDRCVYVAAENLPYYLQTGLRLILANQPIGRRWDITVTAIGLYNRYDWYDGPQRESTRRLTPIVSLDNRFELGAGWNAELKAAYTGKMAYGQVLLQPFGSIDAAVRKSFMKRKASVTLFIRDILATNKTGTTIRLGGRTSFFEETEFRRIAGFSFSYKFHTGRKSSHSRVPEGPEELERL